LEVMDGQNLETIYEIFGVREHVKKLRAEGRKDKLRQLNRILAKFIISRAVDDLSDENLEKLNKIRIKKEGELFEFFTRHIENFSDKLKEYGGKFRRDFAKTGITA
jgi:hypothetical protein